jgi:hypothetical protein
MKKLFLFLIAIISFSCSQESDNLQNGNSLDQVQEMSLEERNVTWLRLDSITYEPRFQVLYFQDKGQKRQLGIFNTSPFLLYPNQTLLIERTINVNIKRDHLGREYLIFKNK